MLKNIYSIDKSNNTPEEHKAFLISKDNRVGNYADRVYVIKGKTLYYYSEAYKTWNDVGIRNKDWFFEDDILIFRLKECNDNYNINTKDNFLIDSDSYNIKTDLYDNLFRKTKRIDVFLNGSIEESELREFKYFIEERNRAESLVFHKYNEDSNSWKDFSIE